MEWIASGVKAVINHVYAVIAPSEVQQANAVGKGGAVGKGKSSSRAAAFHSDVNASRKVISRKKHHRTSGVDASPVVGSVVSFEKQRRDDSSSSSLSSPLMMEPCEDGSEEHHLVAPSTSSTKNRCTTGSSSKISNSRSSSKNKKKRQREEKHKRRSSSSNGKRKRVREEKHSQSEGGKNRPPKKRKQTAAVGKTKNIASEPSNKKRKVAAEKTKGAATVGVGRGRRGRPPLRSSSSQSAPVAAAAPSKKDELLGCRIAANYSNKLFRGTAISREKDHTGKYLYTIVFDDDSDVRHVRKDYLKKLITKYERSAPMKNDDVESPLTIDELESDPTIALQEPVAIYVLDKAKRCHELVEGKIVDYYARPSSSPSKQQHKSDNGDNEPKWKVLLVSDEILYWNAAQVEHYARIFEMNSELVDDRIGSDIDDDDDDDSENDSSSED